MKQIDLKHVIVGEQIFKRTTNGELQPIPDDEPLVLFRGRDRLAVRMLKFYRAICIMDGCTLFQIGQIDELIARFEEFARTSSTMKQPGSTRGF